jgi:molybdopterin synthase catalytic subunit
MRVRVLYFAVLREKLRLEQETLDLSGAPTVGDAVTTIAGLHPEVAGLMSQVQTAVNRTVVVASQVLRDGDELALLPPVAGGSGPRKIAVLAQTLALNDVIAVVEGVERGGVVTFAGVVRRHGHHGEVVRLEYEAYIEMAEQVLAEIAQEIEREWPGVHVAIHHRVGSLAVGETAVVIAAAAPHRAEAFEACRAAIDRLKRRAPIWKKEIGTHGEEWIGTCP